jgi:hypothetical protein
MRTIHPSTHGTIHTCVLQPGPNRDSLAQLILDQAAIFLFFFPGRDGCVETIPGLVGGKEGCGRFSGKLLAVFMGLMVS